jgi:hypothetical protein
MYLLQRHVTRCKGSGRAGYSRSCHRIELEVTTSQPTTMIIACSSDGTPKAWFKGREYMDQGGTSRVGRGKLADYKSYFDLTGCQIPTLFHAGAAIQSRSLPAPKENNATSTTSSTRQTQLARLWVFTNGIVRDMISTYWIYLYPLLRSGLLQKVSRSRRQWEIPSYELYSNLHDDTRVCHTA